MSTQVPRGCRKTCLTRKMNWFSDILYPCPLILQGTEKGLSYAQFLGYPGKKKVLKHEFLRFLVRHLISSQLLLCVHHFIISCEGRKSPVRLTASFDCGDCFTLSPDGFAFSKRAYTEDKAWRKGLNGYFFPKSLMDVTAIPPFMMQRREINDKVPGIL